MSTKQKSAKGRKGETTEQLVDALIKQNSTEYALLPNRRLLYVVVGMITTLLPAFLFQSVKGLEFQGFTIALYLLVSGAAAYVLSEAYHALFLKKRLRLKRDYDRIVQICKDSGKLENKSDVNAQKEQFSELGATGYSFAFANFVFLSLVLFIGFYVLKRADIRVSYTVSLLLSAYAVNWLCSKQTKSQQQQ